MTRTIRQIVAAVLEEEAVRRGAAMDEVVIKAVARMTSFRIEENDRKELQADFCTPLMAKKR